MAEYYSIVAAMAFPNKDTLQTYLTSCKLKGLYTPEGGEKGYWTIGETFRIKQVPKKDITSKDLRQCDEYSPYILYLKDPVITWDTNFSETRWIKELLEEAHTNHIAVALLMVLGDDPGNSTKRVWLPEHLDDQEWHNKLHIPTILDNLRSTVCFAFEFYFAIEIQEPLESTRDYSIREIFQTT